MIQQLKMCLFNLKNLNTNKIVFLVKTWAWISVSNDQASAIYNSNVVNFRRMNNIKPLTSLRSSYLWLVTM